MKANVVDMVLQHEPPNDRDAASALRHFSPFAYYLQNLPRSTWHEVVSASNRRARGHLHAQQACFDHVRPPWLPRIVAIPCPW
eukprot:3990961-Prymnesium_polylepis.1